MKFKKLLLVAIMVASMVAMTACGSDGDVETPITDETGTVETDDQVVDTDDEAVDTDDEVVPVDGKYTGTATTTDGTGEIEVELTILDSKIQDLQVLAQEGIEIDQNTIESFKAEILENQSLEDLALEGVSGLEDEIYVLLQASVNAYNMSLIS
ncbi:hypothetical protein [Tissierella sp. Yu-01]|uniref:hypothetical protein n=1 Tax=Tissierella sp. Yu-01 TaxID=3035694 RepID=UPI00240D2212|nr:hypothetical protein [Tissierella sp. Yu-01]WFA10044.1 hypothetical protein P3962_05680 [Tissierella sp. Yu-01]